MSTAQKDDYKIIVLQAVKNNSLYLIPNSHRHNGRVFIDDIVENQFESPLEEKWKPPLEWEVLKFYKDQIPTSFHGLSLRNFIVPDTYTVPCYLDSPKVSNVNVRSTVLC